MTSIQQTSSPSCPIANAASLRFVLESFIRPERAARFLEHHQVIRSAELRWSSLKNGELLLAAERDGFEVLVTADRNLAYQQNLQARTIAIVVLPSGRWPEIEPHASAVATAVDDAKPGHYIEIPAFTPGPLQGD